MTKEEKDRAFEMGKQAFEKGIRCAPYADINFMEVFIKNSAKLGDGIAPAKSWTAGWVAANLAAPVNHSEMTLDEILQECDTAYPDAEVNWEGWLKITADDLRDYQGRPMVYDR